MIKRSIINFSVISVIALAGVIFMQAMWVSHTLSATKAHSREHIRYSLYQNSVLVTAVLEESGIKEADLVLNNIIQTELQAINKPVSFKLTSIILKSDSIDFVKYEHKIVYDFETKKGIYRVRIDCDNRSWFWIDEILWWSIISLLFIIIITVSVTMSIINQHKTKRLEDIKKDFVSNMTHELKTPIATINVASQMLMRCEEKKLPIDKIFKYSKIIHDENYRLQKLVDKVLMLSIFDKSNKMYNFEEIDFVELIEESVKNVSLLVQNLKGNIVANHIESKILVEADKIHIKNVIINLLENAIKYSIDQPEIEIELVKQNQEIKINIKDNGPGIPDSEKQKIFNRFHRIKSNTTKNTTGFGLGLSYVKKIIEIHNGNIKIVDNKPKGSIFVVTLPMSQSPNNQSYIK